MSLDQMNLGRLPWLMSRLAGEATGIAITPVVEDGWSFSGPGSFVAGWEVHFETLAGSFTYRGETVEQAVDEAVMHHADWQP